MKRMSAKARITIGLVCIQASVLLTALVLGLVPDRGGAVVEGRATLCEAIAVNSSLLIARGDTRRLEAMLEALIARNPAIVSAAVRRRDGALVVEVGEHSQHWQTLSNERSVDTQVYVPIRSGDKKWGSVEIRFTPIRAPGVLGFLADRPMRLIAFVSAGCLGAFYLYLGRILRYLDPSKAVPGRVRSALDTLAEGLMVLDRHGRIVLANEAFACCLGATNEQLLGRQASDLPWIRPEDGTGDQDDPWKRAMRDNAPRQGVVMGLAVKDGQQRTFLVNCSPVQGPQGDYQGVLVSLEDVTQLEATKVELERSKAAAEEANAAKSEFLARMSHEIRTPMNAILGFTDVLMRGYAENAADRAEYLNTIHASGTHLLDLINDILDLSKIEAGRIDVERARCSPYQLAMQVVDALRLRAEEKGITCQLAARTEIPETILTDPVRFRQILTNLVGNAIKFTSAGGVRVELSLIDGGDAPRLGVAVVDSGIGIPESALETIFDPFAQADTTITRRFGGTGLGLPISRRLARALGGDVTVRSTPGTGSVFLATFDPGPLEATRLVAPDPAGMPLAAPTSHQAPVRLPAARVLVVDDGEANRRLMSVVLRRAGLDIVTGENGQQAIDLASQGGFDAVLMDMQMPLVDGYTAASTLRSMGFTRPIIALTADAMDGAEAKCREAGCSAYMTKPIDMDLLVATLRDLLTGSADEVPSPTLGPRTPERASRPEEVAAQEEGGGPEADASPLVSSLPTDDPEFREIIAGWIERLGQQLEAMREAAEREAYAELAALAHWLKGSGETVGFAAFTAPAAELEQLAKAGQPDAIAASLARLTELASRIAVPEAAANASSA